MSTQKLSNISIITWRAFLMRVGCQLSRSTGGHEIWAKDGLTRPITFQTHIDPIPEFIIKNGLRTLGMNKKDFFRVMDAN